CHPITSSFLRLQKNKRALAPRTRLPNGGMGARFQSHHVLPWSPVLPVGQRRQLLFLKRNGQRNAQFTVMDSAQAFSINISLHVNECRLLPAAYVLLQWWLSHPERHPLANNAGLIFTLPRRPASFPANSCALVTHGPDSLYMLQHHMGFSRF